MPARPYNTRHIAINVASTSETLRWLCFAHCYHQAEQCSTRRVGSLEEFEEHKLALVEKDLHTKIIHLAKGGISSWRNKRKKRRRLDTSKTNIRDRSLSLTAARAISNKKSYKCSKPTRRKATALKVVRSCPYI